MASVSFAFDAERPDAARAADSQAARLVVQVSDETRAAIRALVTRAIREGIPPYEAARMIRDVIGLTSRQVLAVANFREQLINQGLVLEKVNQRVERYAAKLLRRRAKTIARTEIIDSLSAGVDESWAQAKRQGLLDGMEEEWIASPDACKQICRPMDGQRVPLGGMFTTGDGRRVRGPTAHPNCTCAKGLVKTG